MRDEQPPRPPPTPDPMNTQHTLHTLRSSTSTVSPYHSGSIKRTESTKSSASDGEIARDERTMRKKIKKQRSEVASDPSSPSHSNESSPGNDKKKGGFIRRMGSIGKKRGESSSTPSPSETTSADGVSTTQDTPPTPPIEEPEQKSRHQSDSQETSVLPNIVSIPIAVEHPIAMRPFTKAAWKRNKKPEIKKPVEEPSPENALRRRIAFVAQASLCLSEDHDDDDEDDDDDDDDDNEKGGEKAEVGSLKEAVALARVRLAAQTPSPPPHSQDNCNTEEEGCVDEMPPYGDLIEPEEKPGNDEPSHAAPSGERREHLYKILVIGELGTGKTSIIKRYVHQFFSQHYRATIGVDFALKVLNWDANTIIRLQLWDIAGQERFGNMTRVYYKEAVGAFIVFDVSRVATFDAVVKWKNDLDTKVQLPDGSPIPCILLANKCDQQKEGVVNTPAKMDEYCREKGFAGWFETSAKENINIEEAARSLVNKILLNDKLLQSNDSKDAEKFALEHKIANGENNRNGGNKSCTC